MNASVPVWRRPFPFLYWSLRRLTQLFTQQLELPTLPHRLPAMSGTLVKSHTHLKDRPHADRASQLLQRVASLVKPVMKKHKWTLPVLSEFFPESPNLLGK